MDADLEKKLTDIGIPKSKIDDIAKKKKYIERIKYVNVVAHLCSLILIS